jgi:hypothetical protein
MMLFGLLQSCSTLGKKTFGDAVFQTIGGGGHIQKTALKTKQVSENIVDEVQWRENFLVIRGNVA